MKPHDLTARGRSHALLGLFPTTLDHLRRDVCTAQDDLDDWLDDEGHGPGCALRCVVADDYDHERHTHECPACDTDS